MYNQINNTLRNRTNSDTQTRGTDPQAYAHGYGPSTAGPSDHGKSRNLQPQQYHPEQMRNERGTFMVPHTGRAYSQHDIDPYRWPSIQDPGMRQRQSEVPPQSAHPMTQAPQFTHHDRWTVILGKDKDQTPGLKRNLSSRDRILNATKRKPSQDKSNLQQDLSSRAQGKQPVQDEQPERPNLSRNPNFQKWSPQAAHQPVREKRAPPVAYNAHAVNIERVVGSARDRLLVTRSGTLRESRSAAGVDTFIDQLKNRPPPSRSGSQHRKESRNRQDPAAPFTHQGRINSFGPPNRPDPDPHEGRRFSFDSEERRHNVGSPNTGIAYCQSPQRKLSFDRPGPAHHKGRKYSFDHKSPIDGLGSPDTERAYYRSPNRRDSLNYPQPLNNRRPSHGRRPSADFPAQYHEASPPPRIPKQDLNSNDLTPAPRRSSQQMFDPQYHGDNNPPKASISAFPTNPNVLHLHRADGTQTAIPAPNADFSRSSLLFSELQSWTARTVALYNDTDITRCCRCEAYYPLCTPRHREGWDLRPFQCSGVGERGCGHFPCGNCNIVLIQRADGRGEGLKKMPNWPDRALIEGNLGMFGRVRWTWLCCCCGTPRRTDVAAGEGELSWKAKWSCEFCGNQWSERCPTFLIGEGDWRELNWVAGGLPKRLRLDLMMRPKTAGEEWKGKKTLGERVEKLVIRGAGKLKKVVAGEVRELKRSLTTKDVRRQRRKSDPFGPPPAHRYGQRHRRSEVRRSSSSAVHMARPTEGIRHRSRRGEGRRRGSSPEFGWRG